MLGVRTPGASQTPRGCPACAFAVSLVHVASFGCMLAVRTPGASQTARVVAACDSAFPFERQGRLLRSRSISGLFSRSLHSGLQPPCLRFATAVTGRHARLGSRLLAKLCRDRHL